MNRWTFPTAIDEIENNFRYEETQINDCLLKQVNEYKCSISYEMNCFYNVFAFDIETSNVEYSEYCESYGAAVYLVNNIYWCFNGNLNREEVGIERSEVHIFDRQNGNPVLKMIEYVMNNYKGETKNVIIKHGNRILSSYKYKMVGHNASGFDNFIVLNSLPSSYKCTKIFKPTRGLKKLSFKASSVKEDDREIPK